MHEEDNLDALQRSDPEIGVASGGEPFQQRARPAVPAKVTDQDVAIEVASHSDVRDDDGNRLPLSCESARWLRAAPHYASRLRRFFPRCCRGRRKSLPARLGVPALESPLPESAFL